jgi:DNA-binding transcriptional ArsR family regulator
LSGKRLRIHFTAEDVGRVRIAPSMDSMWEITLSLHLLRTRESALVFDNWRAQVRNAVRAAGAESKLSLLMAIDPPTWYFPDFLTPSDYRGDLASGLEAIRSTPASQFREELTLLAQACRLPQSARALATGDPDAVEHLCDALRTYHAIALAPFQRWTERRITQVRDRHGEHMTSGGSEHLLRSLEPLCRWDPPVLEAPFPQDREMYLDGRGLRLVPSFFCVGTPVRYFDEELPPTLVYPITHDPRWARPQAVRDDDSLALLVGGTRARILEHVACSAAPTHVLANRLHVAAATVSYHTKVLRDAGLISSLRDGPSVLHDITPLGLALLDGMAVPAGPAEGIRRAE